MPPPPRPPPAYSETHSASPETTPKARPTPAPRDIPAPPALSLSVDDAVDDDDRPAVFPAPNSAQRARGPPKLVPLAAPQRTGLMPPPATPLRAPPSAASSLRIPQTTSVAPTLSSARAQTSRKVTLAPNHSPLDWAALSATLRPLARLRRVTPSELKKHSGRKGKPAWTALAGTVYDMTPYLPFHPGGEPELLRAAGRDGSRLFGEVHPWVNFQGMLSGCVVGILVSEGDEGAANRWDEVD
ncbi:MAG: hypothetical protein M1832_000772 [Thelocarpon impressellum]|nr:MAG: hypothetical protein M1832_000772 [Thelocarpon impressellum]